MSPTQKQIDEGIMHEGFDPNVVLSEIIEGHMENIYDVIEKDYPPSGFDRFNVDLITAMRMMIGECLYELSEGMVNGIKDVETIVKQNIRE